MSADAPKKRGRPRKVIIDAEELTKTAEDSGKAVKYGAEVGHQDPRSLKKTRARKSVAVEENIPTLTELQRETKPVPVTETQDKPSLPHSAYETSKILQDIRAKAPSERAASSLLPPVPGASSLPYPLFERPPLNLTSSPILLQAAALSSNAKVSTPTKAAATTKVPAASKATTPRKAASTPSAKTVAATSPKTSKVTKPAPTTSAPAKSPLTVPAKPTPSKTASLPAKPAPTNPPPSPPQTSSATPPSPPTTATMPPSKPPLPTLKELNASAVSTLSARPGPGAGAAATRSMRTPMDRRDPRYRAAFRRWMTIMVGMPIAIVTSYFLYQRVVMDDDIGKGVWKGLGEVEGVRRVMEGFRKAARGEPAPGDGTPAGGEGVDVVPAGKSEFADGEKTAVKEGVAEGT